MANSFLQWNPRMEMMNGAATGAGGLGVADRETKIQNEQQQQQQERGHETMKQRARKSGKSSAPAPKKLPQRGLGVAQLERLRLQERWKKITEFDNAQKSPPSNIHDHQFLYQQYQFPFPLADHQPHPRLSDGAFSATAGSPSAARSVYPDHFQMDRTRFQTGNLNLYETSKELSSIQTQSQCCSDQCEMCKKKKKHIIHGGNPNHIAPRKFPETIMSIGDKRDFLGWNLGVKSINAEKQQHIGKEEEASEIHSWGNKAVGSCSVLMEYQFFPQKVDPDSGCSCNSGAGGCSSYTDFFNTGVSATGAAVAGEASTTNSLDLSLKLSC